jgi:4-azaleucine resistance transporter AzlC
MQRDAAAEIWRGVRAGLPVAVGYVPMAMAFGVLATQTGLTFFQAGGMSLFVYAGASQFASLGLLAGGASALAVVLATLVLNFRHFLMSVALSRRLPLRQGGHPLYHVLLLLLGFGITDETFVVASLEERLTIRYFIGLIATVYLAWLSGTLVGAGFSSLIPPVIARGMGVALYAMFIAILLPGVKKSFVNGMVAVAGGLLAWGASMAVPAIPPGWRIVIAILLASLIGAVIGGEEPAASPERPA